MTEDLEKYEALLEIAVTQGADLDKLEKLIDLQDRWEKTEARKAFVVAMTEFKKNPPEIIKDMRVEYTNRDETTTSYSHASLSNVTAVISAELSKYGLSGRWDVEQGDFGIKVTFILTHIAGHSESVSMIAPPDSSGKKNPIQAIASTTSYLERYTMLAGTGLAAKGMDDDGVGAGKEEPKPITDGQKKSINKLIKDTGADKTKFLIYLKNTYKTAEITELNTDDAKQVILTLKAKLDFNKKDSSHEDHN